MMEYRTTIGEYQPAGRSAHGDDYESSASDPDPPGGDGWRMVGSAAADGLILWFWERSKSEETPSHG